MKKIPVYLFLTLHILLSSCKNKDGKSSMSGDNGADSLSYVHFKDALKADPAWPKNNVVIVHTISEPDNLHPTNGNSSIRAELQLYTQMSLIQTDLRSAEVRPGLCKDLPAISSNGLQFTFELRDEPLWDDRSPLSVDDVIFTAKANKCPLVQNPAAKPYWGNVKEIKIDQSNKRKFTVIMREPYIQNVAFWSDFPILQRKFFDPQNVLSQFSYDEMDNVDSKISDNKQLQQWAVTFNDQKYGFDPAFQNGLGMYKVEKWESGQSITLTRKPNHWTKGSDNYYEKALPDKIIYKINRDAASTFLEFKSQNMDASGYASVKTLMDLQADSTFNRNYNSKFLDTYGYTYVAMNMRPDGVKHKKLFDDVRVRKAMALLAPVDDMIRIVNKGLNKRIAGPVSILKKEYNPLPVMKLDVSKAQSLLEEAGWKDSDGDNVREKMIDGKKVNFEFDFNFLTTQAEWKDMADILTEGFTAGGVKVNAVPLDPAVFFTKAREHDFDMMMGSWATNSLGEDFTQVWHSSSWTSNGSNYPGFGDAESDSLIDKIKITLDAAQREPMVKLLQEMIYDEQPYIFLYALVRRNILHKRWGNAEMYYDRPGLLFNNLQLLSGSKDEVTN